MKKSIISAALAFAAMAAIGAILAVRAFNGGGSSDAALAAGTQDVFSTLGTAQDTTADEHPWLGAAIVPTPDGLTIGSVIADSPADKAGLKRGDVVKSIDGTAVSDRASLRDALKDKKAGDKVALSITRDGDAQDVTVTLEARPEPLPIANDLFPELNGIPRGELFSHLLGGSFQFTDSDGKTHTATVDLGTVKSVDTDAKKISVDLNSGDSKDYTITDSVTVAPKDLSKFESGDHVTIVSVDGDLRAVSKGMGGFLPGFGGMHGFGGMRGFGPGGDGPESNSAPSGGSDSGL
ncbi:MAG: PDZ domain-containing protein [Dehalococcoidia bacterium]|nr:PDZ domain-containing protein [Dehalococcoidia bacterium]